MLFKGDKVEKLFKYFRLGEVDFFTLFSDHPYRRCKSDIEDNWGTSNHQRALCVCSIKVDYEHILRVSYIFGKREELKDKLFAMEAKVQPCTLDPKFKHVILAS